MRTLPPIPFPAGPAFINILPKRSSSIVVSSNQGLINIVDTSDPTSGNEFYQVRPHYSVKPRSNGPCSSTHLHSSVLLLYRQRVPILLSAMRMEPSTFLVPSTTKEAYLSMVLRDSRSNGRTPPNRYPILNGTIIRMIDRRLLYTHLLFLIFRPLNMIGLPYYNNMLLSSWTPQFDPLTSISTKPPKIPSQILNTMKVNDNIAYAPLPRELRGRRNMVTAPAVKDGGRFISGKSRRREVYQGPLHLWIRLSMFT